MIDIIRNLQHKLKDINKIIKTVKTKQITQKGILDALKDLIDYYFRNVREALLEKNIQNGILNVIDSKMHDLLEATHKNTSRTVYISLFNEIHKSIIQLEKMVLINPSYPKSSRYNDSTDISIIETLNKLLPSAALAYKQALLDMQNENRFSWRGPATDFREALRECLDYLAPDDEVIAEKGYVQNKDTNGPTMKQKAKYILKKREYSNNKIKPTEESIQLIEETLSSFVRSVYTRASISTHTPTDKTEVKRIYDLVKLVLSELLEIS